MATLKVFNPLSNKGFALTMDGSGGIDLDSAIGAFSGTKISFVNDSGYTQFISGINFSGISLNKTLSSQSFSKLKGTVTSDAVFYNGKQVLSLSGLHENLGVFARKFTSDSSDDFAYFFRGNDQITGGKYDDVINGFRGNDKLLGNAGDDVVDGGAGNDSIDSGAGNDQIFTGSGVDIVSTGSGSDIVTISNGNQRTTIKDFRNSSDVIDLTEFGISKYDLYSDELLAEHLSITRSGSNTVIHDVQNELTITLVGINPNSIDWSDFV